MTAARERLSIVVPIALLLIFLLLYFAFNSIRQGLLIYTAIPLSAIGGIFALWARDMPFSISAGVGFIALFGVAVLNGILLVTEFNRLKAAGWVDTRRIVIHATRSKLRAVLMTALVPSLGFIPMAISTGAGAEVQKPLATVVIGGLIIAALLTLFVLPVFYILFEKGFGYLRNPKVAVVMVLLLLNGGFLHAQQPVTLEAAIDRALENNLSLKVSGTETAYYRALRHTAVDLNKTQVAVEYGRFNSRALDNRLAVSQGLAFPAVYRRQAEVNSAAIRLSEANLQQRKVQVRVNVRQSYFRLLLLRQKRALLSEADTMYANFLRKTTDRLKAGDVDLLEKSAAENQRLDILNQLHFLDTDYQVELNHFNMLLNSTDPVTPAPMLEVYQLSALPDTGAVSRSPAILYANRQLGLSASLYKLERSRLLPELTIGYNLATIIGWQTVSAGQDKYYGPSHRFGSVSAGIGIPIFSRAQRSRITAAGILVDQRRQELALAEQQWRTAWQNASRTYARLREVVTAYQATTLPNAALIIRGATEKLNAGEINYLDWVILVNQAVTLRAAYFDTVQQLNDAAFTIESLTPTN